MKTIIQTIGPLYGEIVNGTVFGQPNGSEARPAPNIPASVMLVGGTATMTKTEISGGQIAKYLIEDLGVTIDCGVPYSVYIVVRNASDTVIATGGWAYPELKVQGPANLIPTDGDTVTVQFELRDTYGVSMAASNIVPVTAVIPA